MLNYEGYQEIRLFFTQEELPEGKSKIDRRGMTFGLKTPRMGETFG